MIYTSTNNSNIKELRKLNEKKKRDELNKFLIEGEHLVREAYKQGILEEIIVLENTNLDIDIKTSYATKEVIKSLSSVQTPQNVIGVCKKMEKNELGNKIIMLDDIQDPGNLGAIIRSAVAFNIDTIIISNNSVDIYNPKVIRSTQGMMFNLNIIRTDLKEMVKKLKELDYHILSTNVTGGKNIKELEKRKKICIIMGNEGNGVSDELLNMSDEYIYIKMNEKCESLNVAVATSIILYELGSE